MSNWSDNKKWWMDILKSAIVFTIVTCVSIFFVQRYNAKIDAERSKLKEEIRLKIELSQEYDRASRLYLLSSYDAFRENAKWEKRGKEPKPKDIVNFEDTTFDEWVYTSDLVIRYYPELEPYLKEFDSAVKEMFAFYEQREANKYEEFKTLVGKARDKNKIIIDKLYENHDILWEKLTQH